MTWTKSPDGSERSEENGFEYTCKDGAAHLLTAPPIGYEFVFDTPSIIDAKNACESHAAHISKLVAEAREEGAPKWINGELLAWEGYTFKVIASPMLHIVPRDLPAPPKTSTSATEEAV